MTQEYIIVSKTDIEERIKELENYTYLDGKNEGELRALENIISQSTPLIPEIEKAFRVGFSTPDSCYIDDKQDYISNLKLDI